MRNYYLYLASVIFILVPVSAARPMTSLFAEDLEASMLEIGVITACYSLMPLFLAVLTGRFIDRFGERLPLMSGSIGMAIALFLPYYCPTLFMLYLSQLILGGSQLLALVAIQNGVARSAASEKRDQAIATFSLCASIGLMCGPLIGGYTTEHFGFQNSYFFFCLFSIIPLILGLLVASFNNERSKVQNKKDQRVKQLLAIPGLKRSIFVSMLNLAALDIFYVYYPLYSSSIGMSPSEIGWILAIQSSASVVARIFMPKLVARYGRIQVLSTFMFCGAVAYGILSFVHIFTYIVFITLILGFGLGIAQPLTTIQTYNLAPQGRTGEVLGIRLAGNRLSQVIIPLLFAGISNLTGLGAIFIIEAVVLGAGATFARGIKAGGGHGKDTGKSIEKN